jgi:hypothetical protein
MSETIVTINSQLFTHNLDKFKRITIDLNLSEIGRYRGRLSQALQEIFDPIYDSVTESFPDIEHTMLLEHKESVE